MTITNFMFQAYNPTNKLRFLKLNYRCNAINQNFQILILKIWNAYKFEGIKLT